MDYASVTFQLRGLKDAPAAAGQPVKVPDIMGMVQQVSVNPESGRTLVLYSGQISDWPEGIKAREVAD